MGLLSATAKKSLATSVTDQWFLNPANPASPLSPANPASPLNTLNSATDLSGAPPWIIYATLGVCVVGMAIAIFFIVRDSLFS